MWLGEKTARICGEEPPCKTGIVATGGVYPTVVTEGEAKGATLLGGGAVYIPQAGDEVLVLETGEGQCFVLGTCSGTPPAECQAGEAVIYSGGGGVIKIKSDGSLELSGRIRLSGETDIDGTLRVNGESFPHEPASGI